MSPMLANPWLLSSVTLTHPSLLWHIFSFSFPLPQSGITLTHVFSCSVSTCTLGCEVHLQQRQGCLEIQSQTRTLFLPLPLTKRFFPSLLCLAHPPTTQFTQFTPPERDMYNVLPNVIQTLNSARVYLWESPPEAGNISQDPKSHGKLGKGPLQSAVHQDALAAHTVLQMERGSAPLPMSWLSASRRLWL